MGVAPTGATGVVRKLSCQEVVDQLADYLDEAAHAELVSAVDLHLGACRHCQVEVDTPASLAAKLEAALHQAYLGGCDDEDEA